MQPARMERRLLFLVLILLLQLPAADALCTTRISCALIAIVIVTFVAIPATCLAICFVGAEVRARTRAAPLPGACAPCMVVTGAIVAVLQVGPFASLRVTPAMRPAWTGGSWRHSGCLACRIDG